ncbi:MAG TPA: hypothetical protein VJZ76_00655 [Thermoanaerobaculia bacterium]|nr:hypothetical protein [Thermoanaerobaculia bacterium]
MTDRVIPYAFKYPLLDRGLHFDFLRLRCGTEEAFHREVAELKTDPAERPRTFVALSEWDVLVVFPSTELYPAVLNEFYITYGIDAKIAGTAGYFAYLWDHELNAKLDNKLDRFQKSGIAFVISLRFEDWVRRELGLGAEILFCDYLKSQMHDDPTLTAIVAHTLGWNDIVIVLHATANERRLLEMQSQIRLLTLDDIVPRHARYRPPQTRTGEPMFAASYTHIIGSYAAFRPGHPVLGNLADDVLNAMLLVRVAPALEWRARDEIEKLGGGCVHAEDMPTELGHYTFSTDITRLVADGNGGVAAMDLVARLRTFIGDNSHEKRDDPDTEIFNSYAETTTILRFRDPSLPERTLRATRMDKDICDSVKGLRKVMEDLPEQLRGRHGSGMTAHRFGIVLTTLLDHLADPVRSSVVRHITRFLIQTTNIPDLDRQDMEDLCQVAEYAMSQATDGIAQYQHDANALGLTGRGGYSRLITAIEMYVDDILGTSFSIFEKTFLITFGQHLGHVGSVAKFHIDVPFNILFSPSRWYVLLHEAGHMAWAKEFGWMAESLAIYEAMEAEFMAGIESQKKLAEDEDKHQVPMEFIRTRELIRELFPNMLVFFITCGGEVGKFDHLSLRHILSRSRPGRGTRELLFAVVLSCLLRMTAEARKGGEAWFARALSGDSMGDLSTAVRGAIGSVNTALDSADDETLAPHVRKTLKNKQMLLNSEPFRNSVTDVVRSVLDVLSLLAKPLSNEQHLGKYVLDSLQKAIDDMAGEYDSIYSNWRSQGFDGWITGGRVLATSPGAHIWARLLYENREATKSQRDKTGFMRSQMAALLSIWHRAVVSGTDEQAALRIRKEILIPLGLVTEVNGP